MATQVWTTPVNVGVQIPTDQRDVLSFSPSSSVYKAMRVAPDPDILALNPDGWTYLFDIPVHALADGLPVGGWAQVFMEPVVGFLEDPTWEAPESTLTDADRMQSGQMLTVLNPPAARVDGLPDPWAAQINREPTYGWGQPVAARKLVLEERSKVVVSAAQNTDPGARLFGVVIDPTGEEASSNNGWFGNRSGNTGSATFSLDPGVYMLLVGPANAYNASTPSQEFTGTLTITVT